MYLTGIEFDGILRKGYNKTNMMKKEIYGTANIIFENGNNYRYFLTRVWEDGKRRVCFVMLNPSTANATTDDATIRRCISFAQEWGFGSLEVVNLFALITPDPTVLETTILPVGTCNDREIKVAMSRADLIVVAWGAFKQAKQRSRDVLKLICRAGHDPFCLGKNKDGSPKHPLYIRGDTKLTEFAHII